MWPSRTSGVTGMRNRREFLALAGLGALAAGCGAGTGRQGVPPPSTAFSAGPPPSARAKVTLQQWYHAYGEDGVQDAVKLYASRYPNARVAVQWHPGDYDAKIAAALGGGAVPDVFEAQVKIDWVRQNRVAALDDVITSARADFSPAVLAAHTVDGRIYGIPQATDTQVIFYRKSLLQTAGVAPPQSV